MSKQLGRISGPLLSANLLREGTDLRFQNQLLYLDVTNKTLSINSTPINKELFVNGTLRTVDVLVDAGKVTAGDFELGPTNLIRTTSAPMILNGADYVQAHSIKTDDIEITGQSISTYTTETDIEVRPTGTLEVYADTNVTGNLHATGNITADGSVIFGNADTDSVTFASDITSDIIPDLDSTYSLGEDGKQWNNTWTKNFVGQILYTNGLFNNGLPVGANAKNQWFVATLGLDTNVGINESSAFATIAKALSVASLGDTVYIAPGTYTEIFPLTVPAGVTVKGISLRSVTVQPTAETQNNNAFLLNGETTVSDLTVANFYQGYAFSFASGAKITTRSPYIQNCSVITNGVSAGGGAMVDGGVCNANTVSASMLFHSCTFITPGVDALTMTNSVRVEWVNCFTYFARRGAYLLFQQSTVIDGGSSIVSGTALEGGDSITTAQDTITGGPAESFYDTNGIIEFRSINSANVYGTYGVVADGANTLAYLVGHNFSYIGSELDSSNDNTLVVQANEVTELNNGKIYYQSVDQQGNYRVGNEFFVNFDNGTTTIDINSGAFTGISSLTIGIAPEQTFIDYSKIDVGNFTIRGNDILTRSNTFNVVSASNEVNLTENVSVAKDLSVEGNLNIGGTITVGNQTGDSIDFVADVDSDIIPNISKEYSLGSPDKQWAELNVTETYINNVKISSNEISILTTDTDLTLNATGKISVPTNDVEVSQTLTTTGTTTATNINVTGTITHISAYNQTELIGGEQLLTDDNQILLTEDGTLLVAESQVFNVGGTNRRGNTYVTENVTATVSGTVSDITFSNNTIQSDNSLNIILASGTGKLNIVSDTSYISIKNNRLINNTNNPILFSTTNSYVKFAGTGAMAIPVGTESERPATAETGTLRVNSTSGNAEVYTQPTDTWSDVTGLGDIATRENVEEYGNLWILILG